MRNFILPGFTAFLLIILTLIPVTMVFADTPNLNGTWSDGDKTFEVTQTGNSITLTDNGTTRLVGTITTTTFEGKRHLYSKTCRNLDKYVPATGTISTDRNSIVVKFINNYYDTGKCSDDPGTEFEDTATYTRISSTNFTKPVPTSTPNPSSLQPLPKPTVPPQKPVESVEPDKAKVVNDWIANTFGMFDPNQIQVSNVSETSNRPPSLTGQNAAILLNSEKDKPGSPYSVGFINMETEEGPMVRLPGSNEYKPLSSGEITPGSTILSKNNSIGILVGAKGLVFIKQDSEVTLSHEGIDKAVENGGAETNSLYVHQGELEVKTEKGNNRENIRIQTDLVTTRVRSHFWVSQSRDSKQTLVGVYEGNVEVKTKDGQITTVSPKGDKPEVVMIVEKFSFRKLGIAGLVLISIVAGVVLIIRKKIMSKMVGKKRRN